MHKLTLGEWPSREFTEIGRAAFHRPDDKGAEEGAYPPKKGQEKKKKERRENIKKLKTARGEYNNQVFPKQSLINHTTKLVSAPKVKGGAVLWHSRRRTGLVRTQQHTVLVDTGGGPRQGRTRDWICGTSGQGGYLTIPPAAAGVAGAGWTCACARTARGYQWAGTRAG